MLLVFGSINIDFIFPVSRLPQAGDTLWAEGARTEPGGKGANAAVAAARDRAAVTLVGAVGHDVLADAALAGLERAGVTLSHIARAPTDTGRAAVCIDPAGRSSVAVQAGANAHAKAGQVPDSLLTPRTTLLVQLETEPAETEALILRARRRGARVVLQLSPARMIGTAALTAADVLVGNNAEFAWAGEHLGTGSNPASLASALGVAAVRMMGVQGAESMSAQGYRHMPAFAVHSRDTTGAGDCFAGVLAAALARGARLDAAMRRASVAAALSTKKMGAQGSMPGADEIDLALRDAPDVSEKQAEVLD